MLLGGKLSAAAVSRDAGIRHNKRFPIPAECGEKSDFLIPNSLAAAHNRPSWGKKLTPQAIKVMASVLTGRHVPWPNTGPADASPPPSQATTAGRGVRAAPSGRRTEQVCCFAASRSVRPEPSSD